MEKDVKMESPQQHVFNVNGASFNMNFVEGGTFEMGCSDKQAYGDEKPVHTVTLDGFFIGELLVTQGLWKAVMGECVFFKGDDMPVWDSWECCQDFIVTLNRLTKKDFRLPTEAEWEFAARGGVKSQGFIYAGGNDYDEVMWCYDNDKNVSQTHPVKTKKPNELGLYDMSGLVDEWCLDWYGKYSSGKQTNPKGAVKGDEKVQRGGCWRHSARCARVSARSSSFPHEWGAGGAGFRLVLPI